MKNAQEKANIIEFVGFAHTCLTGGLSTQVLEIEDRIKIFIEQRGVAETERIINDTLKSANASPLIRMLCKSFIYRHGK